MVETKPISWLPGSPSTTKRVFSYCGAGCYDRSLSKQHRSAVVESESTRLDYIPAKSGKRCRCQSCLACSEPCPVPFRSCLGSRVLVPSFLLSCPRTRSKTVVKWSQELVTVSFLKVRAARDTASKIPVAKDGLGPIPEGTTMGQIPQNVRVTISLLLF